MLVLVINKVTEERGCLDDLIKLLNSANKDSRTINNENGLTSGSTNDQCHKLGSYSNEVSLCKCTNNLCNSSLKQVQLIKPLWISLIFFVEYILRVFL
jgi:hypothetical protein